MYAIHMLRVCLATVLWAISLSAEFRAGVSKIDITPSTPKWLLGYGPRQNTGILDRIYHRAVAFDDGRTQFFLVTSDLCLFSPALYDEVAATLEKQQGIKPENFWWSVTHTHSAPEVGPWGVYPVLLKGRTEHDIDQEYTTFIKNSIVEAVTTARKNLASAKIGFGTGYSAANINRRARDIDGRISLGLNPDGPTDRQIGIIRIDTPQGKSLAVIANYAMHGTVLGGRWTQISGDAQGVVAQHVEEKLGTTMLYINGAAGNLAPIYTTQNDPKSGHLGEFKVLLGERILAAHRNIAELTDTVALRPGRIIVDTKRKPGLDWTSELQAYAKNAAQPLVRIPIRFLTIGDTAIWTAPLEVFCELTHAIRQSSPFARTFFFGYTNGWFGYLPTKAGFEEGGYEPATSVLTGEAEHDVVTAVIAHLQSLPR